MAARDSSVHAHEEWFALLQTSKVSPEDFGAAQERHDDAFARYEEAEAVLAEAGRVLRSLHCQAEFVDVVAGPWDDGDTVELDETCRRQRGHEGDHLPYEVPASTAPAEYREAFSAAVAAARAAGRRHYQWTTAESELEALMCGHMSAGVWPCVARRGHKPASAHDHPTEMHLVG